MSSSNTSTADIDAIKYVMSMFAQVWSYLLIVLGTIGHSLNIYIFTRPVLRPNPCVSYFLASSISGFLVIYINILLRLLQLMYNIDAFIYSSASCKILTFITLWTRTVTSWFIAFACVDRFLCSSRSVNMRAWSNRRVAIWVIVIISVLVGLVYIYVPILFEIEQTFHTCPTNLNDPPAFNGIWNLITFSLGPSIVMLIFGLLTIRHIQTSIRRVIPSIADTRLQLARPPPLPLQEQLQNQKATDRQLTQMMIAQFVYFSLLTTPVSIFWLYNSFNSNMVSDALQSIKDQLFAHITGFLSITCACTTFYSFTLSSKLFRRELISLFRGRRRTNER